MTTSAEASRRDDLLEQIQKYDELIASYQIDDRPKSRKYLEKLNTDDLIEWLNTRMTNYQFQVDNDITEANPSCENETGTCINI